MQRTSERSLHAYKVETWSSSGLMPTGQALITPSREAGPCGVPFGDSGRRGGALALNVGVLNVGVARLKAHFFGTHSVNDVRFFCTYPCSLYDATNCWVPFVRRHHQHRRCASSRLLQVSSDYINSSTVVLIFLLCVLVALACLPGPACPGQPVKEGHPGGRLGGGDQPHHQEPCTAAPQAVSLRRLPPGN